MRCRRELDLCRWALAARDEGDESMLLCLENSKCGIWCNVGRLKHGGGDVPQRSVLLEYQPGTQFRDHQRRPGGVHMDSVGIGAER